MIRPLHLSHDWYPQPLPDNVRIGEGSWLYSTFAFLHFRSQRQPVVCIGRSCGVYNGSFFDLGSEGSFELGDFSTLVGVIVSSNEHVRIGSSCFLAHEVLMADEAAACPFRGAPADTRERNSQEERITLGDDVWVGAGAGAVLLRGADIGDGSIVGAATVVDFKVPANSIVAGNPARVVGTIG